MPKRNLSEEEKNTIPKREDPGHNNDDLYASTGEYMYGS